MNNVLTVSEFIDFELTKQSTLDSFERFLDYGDNRAKWKGKTVRDYLEWSYTSDDCVEHLYFETNVSWYPLYSVNNKHYVCGTVRKWNSNLELYTICLSGNDDYSLSKDYTSWEDCMNDWKKLKNSRFVNHDTLTNTYFSN